MFNKLLKLIVITTFTVVTVLFVYTTVMTLFFHVDYEKNYVMGCFTYYFGLAIVLYGQKNKHIYLNSSLLYLFLIFAFSANILGELFNFYYRFAIWDNLLHIIAGILVTVLMLNLLVSLSGTNLTKNYPKIIIFLFIVGTTVSVGVCWEIYEFAMDTILNYNMQKTFFVDPSTDFSQYVNAAHLFVAPSLVDTMLDLIEEGITSIIATTFIIIYGPILFYNKFLNKKNHVEKTT